MTSAAQPPVPMPGRRAPTARELWGAFAVAFGLLALGASPSHFWLDSGELAAAGFELGVVHPPGTPGLVLLLRVLAWVPVGPVGFRMALLGCAMGAGAVTLVGVVLARHGASLPLRWGAAAWVLAGLTFVRQARVVEVYALAAVLLMVTLWGFDPAISRERRLGPRLVGTFAAVWAAWCFGDLRLALAPLVVVAWWLDMRRGHPWARWAPVVVVMASAVVLALPLASVSGPWMDWGDPQSARSLWSHLQAQSIRAAFADEILAASPALWWLHTTAAVSRLAEDLGAPGLVLATAALLGQAWTRPWAGRPATRADRQIARGLLWIVGVECFYIVGINPMGGADRQTGIVLGPIAAVVVGRVLAAWFLGRARLAWAMLPLACVVMVGPALLRSGADGRVTASWGPHAWTRGALAQLPPGTLLLTQSDDLAAGLAFAAVLEGARPDVITAPAQHLHKAAPDASARRQAPWHNSRNASTERGRIEAALAAHRGPVAVEHPAATLMSRVRYWSDRGAVPLAIGRAPHLPMRPSAIAEVQRWRTRLTTAVDRSRLAVALAERARGVAKVEGDFATAVEMLRVSIRDVSDDHASAFVALAALVDRAGDRQTAIALTRRALEIEPGRSVALTNLALYLAADAQTQAEATTVAERAVALRPWRRDVWERLAQVREAVGDGSGAARARAHAAERIGR